MIRGRIVAADTGVPLRRAQIRLTTLDATGASALAGTDDEGRYEYGNLAPGRYTVTAEKAGYLKSAYGQRGDQETARPLDLAEGQILERVDLSLRRGGSVVVRVTDDRGEPFAGAEVNLEQFRFVNGERRLQAPYTVVTDESGLAQLSELPSGEYYVFANAMPLRLVTLGTNNSPRILASTYHPGVTSIAEAVRVSVAAGQEVSLDLALAAVATVKVSGTARGPNGETVNGNLGLVTRPIGGAPRGVSIAAIQADGSFTFNAVVPGRYFIRVNSAMTPRQYVNLPIDVAGDVTGIVVTTTDGGSVRGRMVFDGGKPPANLQREAFATGAGGGSRAFALRADPSWATVMRPGMFRANDDGTFELVNIVGQSVLRPVPPGLPNGWFLKAVTLDGKDVTDTMLDFTTSEIRNLEVAFTQKQTEVSGTASDAPGALLGEFVAVVFPEDRQRWTPQTRWIAAGRSDLAGRFRVTGLPPGRYLAAAVSSLGTGGEEHDQELLQRLEASATRFTLEEDEKRSISLRLVR